jgi:DtxR family Mn-dependent transcriptional regulator
MEELTESQQNYLETIYVTIMDKNGVRVKDIAKQMGVKNSSVVSALRSLGENGYINYEPYGIISLTPKGNTFARRLREKHRILQHFFEWVLGVDRESADESACRMEHVMEDEVFSRFTQFIKYIYLSHKKDPGWLEGFKKFYAKDFVDMDCEVCREENVREIEGLEAG